MTEATTPISKGAVLTVALGVINVAAISWLTWQSNFNEQTRVEQKRQGEELARLAAILRRDIADNDRNVATLRNLENEFSAAKGLLEFTNNILINGRNSVVENTANIKRLRADIDRVIAQCTQQGALDDQNNLAGVE